jgi:integrase
MKTTYDVRVWKLQSRTRTTRSGKKSTSYVVRWLVAGQRFEEWFRNRTQADSFRSDLVSAARNGEAFDTATGLPVSKLQTTGTMAWFDFACDYSEMKWHDASAGHRKNIATDLSAITLGMIKDGARRPADAVLRSALRIAFNPVRRSAMQPLDIDEALDWLARNTRPVGDLGEPDVLRALLGHLDAKKDGGRAAADTVRLRRTTLTNALDYAVDEKKLLAINPLSTIKVKKTRTAVREVDKQGVPNPDQARKLLNAIKQINARLHAFFGLLYFAGLRPEEAANLRRRNLAIPEAGWGELHLERAAPEISGQWTDTGLRNEERALKHRGLGDTRTVPCSPELTALLHEHIRLFGMTDDGRLFRGVRSGERLSSSVYGRAWASAREAVFTDEVAASALARRPYDLRHAAVSTWLAAGVEAPRVAKWAGHSLSVLLRVYAKFLDGGEEEARRLVERRLGV